MTTAGEGHRPSASYASSFLAAGAAFVLALAPQGASVSATAGDLVRVESSDAIMGTTFSVVLYGREQVALEAAAQSALEEARRLDRMLSNYRPDSEWSEVNRGAPAGPVAVSEELFQLLSDCMDYSRQSNGAFDITVGRLMKVWGFYKGEGVLPRKADVAEALRHVGYEHVRLDRAARTVQFTHPGLELDPGGIGKGYAVDRMVDVLKRQGVSVALVSAGGSSIYGLGAPPDDARGWPITIRAPRDPERRAEDVWLKDMSLSTSGGYEKFFFAGGLAYSHIMDPRTGYPAKGTSSVSVLAPRAIDSEAWTKPYFVNGRGWTAGHVPRHFRVFFCDDTRQGACGWVPQTYAMQSISSSPPSGMTTPPIVVRTGGSTGNLGR